MTVKKPTMIKKTPAKISKYIAGGTRSKTTKIAWHYTGLHDVKGINTINNWFNSINRGYKQNGKYLYASAHFVMDLDGAIYEYVPMKRIAWTTNAANYYSIGIECATTGSDDHYSDKEYVSMVKLGAWLAQYYGLDPRKDFIRHTDVVGRAYKICPKYFVDHEDKWNQFKLDCYNYMKGKLTEANIRNCTNKKGASIVGDTAKKEQTAFKQYIVRCTVESLNGRTGPGSEYSVACVITKGTAVTIVGEYKAKDGGTWLKTKSGYYINKKFTDFVRYV